MNIEILEEYIRQEWAPNFRYAQFDTIPWTPFSKALRTATIGLVTTAGVHLRHDPPFAGIDDGTYREIPGLALVSDITASHPFFETRELEQDLDAIFPVTRLQELQQQGSIARVAPLHYSFMGMVPHWERVLGSARDMAAKLTAAGVDAVVLTPGSPLCTHTLAVIQRVVEASGLATIALTIEPDLSRLAKVPRAMSVDFPPGCPVGEPTDHDKQRRVLQEALEYLTTMTEPGTVWKSPFKWTRSCSAPVCKLPH